MRLATIQTPKGPRSGRAARSRVHRPARYPARLTCQRPRIAGGRPWLASQRGRGSGAARCRAPSRCHRQVARAHSRSSKGYLHWTELPRSRRGERRAHSPRAGPFQQIRHGDHRPRRCHPLAGRQSRSRLRGGVGAGDRQERTASEQGRRDGASGWMHHRP